MWSNSLSTRRQTHEGIEEIVSSITDRRQTRFENQHSKTGNTTTGVVIDPPRFASRIFFLPVPLGGCLNSMHTMNDRRSDHRKVTPILISDFFD